MPPGFRPRFALLLFAVPLAALTCDDARRDDPLSERVAAAYCAHQFDCCSPFEITLMSSDRYETEAECLPFATLAARQQLGTVEGAIAQGRITVDAARADACLAAYRDQRCGNGAQTRMQPVPVPQAVSPALNAADVLTSCPDMLIGHVPDGRACNLSLECTRGSRCVSGTSGGGYGIGGAGGALVATPGVCARYQPEGEPCNLPSDCDPARHSCHTPDYVCGPKSQRGEACTVQLDITGSAVDDCDASQGLFCDQTFSSSCQRYPTDGEPCNPFTFPQCDPAPELALTCNQFTGTCRRPGGEGEACGGPALPPCRADLACRPVQADGIGTCGAIPTLGERCLDRCASPAICAGSACVSPGAAAVGAPCAYDHECGSMSCSGFQAGRRVCAVPPYAFAQCLGAGVTAGNVTGAGIGGMSGTAGASGTAGVGARGGPTGAGGAAGAGGLPGGCPISAIAPDDPIIADFDVDVGDATLLPIGGTFTYGSPSPTATISDKAWRITLAATGDGMAAKFLGAGIYFNADSSGLACIDASFHTGVQFDISGTIAGTGCTVQYATNDSAHADRTLDPRGSGPPSAWAPQAPLTVTATPTTVMMPFFGTGAPSGGAPPVPIDPSRLTGVVWQFTVALGTANSCVADLTIDNVRFF
jgi:hypothetical protein